MTLRQTAFTLATAVCLFSSTSTSVLADSGRRDGDRGRARIHGQHRDGEDKASYRDGPCKVELERKIDGSYKEERECKGARDGPSHRFAGDHEEKYWDGPCRIEREWKRDGTYKEKLDCKPDGR